MTGIKNKKQIGQSARTRWRFRRRQASGQAVVTEETNFSGMGFGRSIRDWFTAFASGVQARLRARQQELTRVSRLQDDPQGNLEEIVREMESVADTLRGQDPDDALDDVLIEPSYHPAHVRTVPAILVRVGRRPAVLKAEGEAEILDDPGRLVPPERPAKTAIVRFTHVGRRSPRISEDES